MTADEVTMLILFGCLLIVGLIRWRHQEKQDRELEREKNSPRPREMNKTEF
jgi:hypothetical protein